MPSNTYWIPLESNPDVWNEFTRSLGVVNVPTEYQWCDVMGLDDDLLAFVPSPVVAVILLFPVTGGTEQENSEPDPTTHSKPPSLFYMKQTIGNACGTIALLHACCNLPSTLKWANDSFISKFYALTHSLTPDKIGAFLENPPEGGPSMEAIHKEAAKQGATAAPEPDANVDLHFVAFVPFDDGLWELDGRKPGPIYHGATSEESLLHDVATVVKRDFLGKTNSLNFSLIALAPSDSE